MRPTMTMTTDIYRKGYVRYGVALAAAALGYSPASGADSAGWGPNPTYITFYPLVMLAALLGASARESRLRRRWR